MSPYAPHWPGDMSPVCPLLVPLSPGERGTGEKLVDPNTHRWHGPRASASIALSPRRENAPVKGDKTGGQRLSKFACALSPIVDLDNPHEAVPNPNVLAGKKAVPNALPRLLERIVA